MQQVQVVMHTDAKTLKKALMNDLPKLYQGRLPEATSEFAGLEAEHKFVRSRRMVRRGASGAGASGAGGSSSGAEASGAGASGAGGRGAGASGARVEQARAERARAMQARAVQAGSASEGFASTRMRSTYLGGSPPPPRQRPTPTTDAGEERASVPTTDADNLLLVRSLRSLLRSLARQRPTPIQ